MNIIPRVVTAVAGEKGFDCNAPITEKHIEIMGANGYSFAERYVGRRKMASQDITDAETERILTTEYQVVINNIAQTKRMKLCLVQHVEADPWKPTGALGEEYGGNAVKFAIDAGYSNELSAAGEHATLALDLEGVAKDTPAQNVIDSCNAWWSQVSSFFAPILYVGYQAGLSGHDLYYKLKFDRYWSAYNLNRDLFPAVRGVQMKQGEYPGAIQGIPWQFDTDIVQADTFGSLPTMAAL